MEEEEKRKGGQGEEEKIASAAVLSCREAIWNLESLREKERIQEAQKSRRHSINNHPVSFLALSGRGTGNTFEGMTNMHLLLYAF